MKRAPSSHFNTASGIEHPVEGAIYDPMPLTLYSFSLHLEVCSDCLIDGFLWETIPNEHHDFSVSFLFSFLSDFLFPSFECYSVVDAVAFLNLGTPPYEKWRKQLRQGHIWRVYHDIYLSLFRSHCLAIRRTLLFEPHLSHKESQYASLGSHPSVSFSEQ